MALNVAMEAFEVAAHVALMAGQRDVANEATALHNLLQKRRDAR